MMMPNRSNNS